MIRRSFLVPLALTLVVWAGCGTFEGVMMQADPVWLRGRLSRTYAEPSHRVALATLEILKAELASLGPIDCDVTPEFRFNPPGISNPRPDQVQLPQNFPAFWLEGLAQEPALVNYRRARFSGTTRDGRPVVAILRLVAEAPTPRTAVDIQVGQRGDELASRLLLDKIGDRVAFPTYKHGSLEESKALQAIWNVPADAGAEASKTLQPSQHVEPKGS